MLGNSPSHPNEHQITVLLIDDQAIIGEAVRRMLAADSDIIFHFCNDPAQAIQKAIEVSPTVILQDLVMPEIDGLTLLKFFRANPKTRDIPMIVLSSKEEVTLKAEAFAIGANDYLVKLPDKIELIARIRHHSRGYINLLQRNQAYEDLQIQKARLEAELSQAADYVRSLLPADLNPTDLKSDISIRSCFRPSTELGGDSFDYYWLDRDRLIVYLLDVSGHGVGAALLSVSILNVLRSRSLRNSSDRDTEPVDFGKPSQVLSALKTIYISQFGMESMTSAIARYFMPVAVILLPFYSTPKRSKSATRNA
jgi:phosphoserine phosphatase RsbU/P